MFLGVGVGGPPATAQEGFERVVSYRVQLDIRADGQLAVDETIEYDFGPLERHGIYRTIPVRFPYEPDGDYERVYKVGSIDVEASEGTPDGVKTTTDNGRLALRIGDPDKTIRGRHSYRIRYVVRGALNAFDDHDELYWNAVGHEWSVPIESAAVTVTAPGGINRIACFAGPSGSNLPCASASPSGTDGAVFAHTRLGPQAGVTVVVGLDKGVVRVGAPILDEKFSLVRAFAVTPATATGAGLLALLSLGYVGRMLWRTGRDRHALLGGEDGLRPLGEDAGGPVAYRPPDGVRPAQLGVLIDERADPLDATATIIDLAVRGHLVIEEIPKEGWFGKADWRLLATAAPGDDLLPYEKRLLEGLFSGQPVTTLSALKNQFAPDLKAVQKLLYSDCVKQGWFSRSPEYTRGLYLGIGVMALIGSGIALGVLIAFTHAALLGVPLLVTALVLIIGHRWAPARTAKGSAALRHAIGFREYITTAEADRMQFAESENIFARYLPYAIIFGATEKWAKAFAGLDGAPPPEGLGWYHPHGSWSAFNAGRFADSMDNFTVQTAGTIVSTPSSSGGSGFGGGGFSGGGGGGGGGGSW